MNNLIQLITASGGGALLLAIANAFMSRRRSGADATSILTRAAAQLVQDTQAQSHVLALRVATLEREVLGLQLDARSNRKLLELHGRWDRQVIATLRRNGIEVESQPPPLYPDDIEE